MQLQLVHDVKLPAPAKQNFSVHLKSETGSGSAQSDCLYYREWGVVSGSGHLQAGSSAYQQFHFLSVSFFFWIWEGKHLHVEN